MDENTSKAIFNLMQNVVDKLDAISKDLNKKEPVKTNNHLIKNDKETTELILRTIQNQVKLEQITLQIENRIINSIKNNRITPAVNNYTEYSLFGSKSYLKPRTVILMIFSLVIIWSSIKYLPSYITEQSLLSREKEAYQIFYNYVYLKQFKNHEIITDNEILKKINQKDSIFMEEYQTLISNLQKELRKQELKEELNSLDNNDR